MRYSNVDFNIVYVDPSRSSDGDGTTPATAKKGLPTTAAAFAENTCYLIRRTAESSACVIPNGTNSSVTNLLLMGMPTASDPMWELVPQVARTAWGSDSAEYANVQSTVASGSFQLPYAQHFLLHRAYLFRDSINADNYILKFSNSSDKIGCFAFEHCKFGSRGVDVDRASYAAEVTASRLKAYVYVYYARMVSIVDCTINHCVVGSGSADGIYVYWSDVMNVHGVRVNSPAWRDNSQSYALNLSSSTTCGVECSVSDVTQTVRMNGTASRVPQLLSLQGYASVRVRNLKVVTGTPLSSARPSSFAIEYPVVQLSYCWEVDIRDVDISLPDCWNCKAAALRLNRCYASSYVPGVAKPIRNVKVVLATESGIGTPITYANATRDDESYAAVSLDFSYSDADVYAKVPTVDGITVRCPRGKALFATNVRMTEAVVEGTLVLRQSVADVLILSTWFPGKAIFASEGTHARVHELVCNVSNPDYPFDEDPAVGSDFDDNGDVFVDVSNTALRPMAIESSTSDRVYQGFGCNNEGAEGHFAYRCANGLADTWSVHREGGGASAIKIYDNGCSRPGTMVLGRRPFKGMQILPTTTGRHVLKAHVAFKGYAKPAELYRHFFISAEVCGRTYYSTLHGRWSDDTASVWKNDSELSQLVLEMPVEIPEVSPVDVRVYFSWYAAGGFVYLDPDIKLVEA